MVKYIIKRILLMFFSLFVITTICFVLIRLLPREVPTDKKLAEVILAKWEALGYNEPIPVQYGIYLREIFTKFDFGTSWKIDFNHPVTEVFAVRFTPTIMLNIYSLLFSIPVGILLGIYAAIKKNKWQDQVINVLIILFISIPTYVYAFMLQYIFGFKLKWFPNALYSLDVAGGSYFTWKMFYSMILPILSLSFMEIAGMCRFVRAELTETLTSDYMLLARTKGLTKTQATVRHALKNAMVPTLPMIIGSLFSILSGSLIIEQIFSVPGVGKLYVMSVQQLDYDVFMIDTIFYTLIGLSGGIVVDLSYGFLDPRIRMGER